jgi:hypothetical protein
MLQVVPQLLPAQANGPQSRVRVAGPQLPRPLHVRGDSSVPVLQLAPAHSVPAAYSWQFPLPSQDPSRPHVDTGSAAQLPRRSAPAGTGTQLPTWPATAQEKQLCPQAAEQQTLSKQLPVPHWTAAVQGWATVRFTLQVPASQKKPVWQSLSLVHWVPQELPMHRLGAQLFEAALRQVPLPSQVRAANSVALLQLPGTHSVPAG